MNKITTKHKKSARLKMRLRKVFYATACFGLMVSSFTSCRKQNDATGDGSSLMQAMSSTSASNDYIYGDGGITTSTNTYTQLGRKYNQPLSVQNVMNAWNALSDEKITTLEPTHRYIKLKPNSFDDLKAIRDAKIPTYTFPLDYEIVQYGSYMRDPALEPNGIPPLYTLIPVEKQIPITNYELLDNIYFLDLRSVVAEKAFELAKESEMYPIREKDEQIPSQLLSVSGGIIGHVNNITAPHWKFEDPNDYIPSPPPPAPPTPGPADNVGTPSTVINACACNLNSDDRKPSGCIKVEETQFYNGNVVYEGVNDILVDFLGPLFQRVTVRTNANGCYKSDWLIRYKLPFGKRAPVFMSVVFQSPKKTIKAVKDGSVPEFVFPNTHWIGNVAPGGLNNCNVTYNRSSNVSNHETKHYSAATINNALYDFDGYASADGLMTTHNNLQILIHRFDGDGSYAGSGAAPMFDKMQMSGSLQAITIGTFLSATVGGIAGIAPNPVGSFTSDVYFCYNRGTGGENYNSDKIKELAYHEFAHVIHYKKVGNPMWEMNIQFIVNNLGYGDASKPGSGRCALMESWAYFLGRDYAHRRYGPIKHSFFPSNFLGSFYAQNEITSFDDYFPSGFLHDLKDDNAYNTANGLTSTIFMNGSWITIPKDQYINISDSCRGYTNSMIFSKMGNTTNTITGLIDKLDDNLPSGTTQANYNLLRQSYGY